MRRYLTVLFALVACSETSTGSEVTGTDGDAGAGKGTPGVVQSGGDAGTTSSDDAGLDAGPDTGSTSSCPAYADDFDRAQAQGDWPTLDADVGTTLGTNDLHFAGTKSLHVKTTASTQHAFLERPLTGSCGLHLSLHVYVPTTSSRDEVGLVLVQFQGKRGVAVRLDAGKVVVPYGAGYLSIPSYPLDTWWPISVDVLPNDTKVSVRIADHTPAIVEFQAPLAPQSVRIGVLYAETGANEVFFDQLSIE